MRALIKAKKFGYILLVACTGLLMIMSQACASRKGQGETLTILPTFEKVFELPFTLDGTVSMSWDYTGEQFIIVGGDDQFAGNPIHTRFIVSGDTNGIEIIESVDDPEFDDYQRYKCVRCNPVDDYALVSGNGGLWKLSDRHMEEIPIGTNEPLWSIIWEPNGEYALIGGWDFILKYDGMSIQEIDTGGHGFIDASWSPDGTYVLLADNDKGEIGMYDGESFHTIAIPDHIIPAMTEHDEYKVQTVSFSPVSEYALIGAQNSIVNGPYQALIGYNGTGFELIECPIHQFPDDIFWKPNGSYAYLNGSFGENTAIIYQDGGTYSIDMGENVTALGWTPDGEYLVVYSAEAIEFYSLIP